MSPGRPLVSLQAPAWNLHLPPLVRCAASHSPTALNWPDNHLTIGESTARTKKDWRDVAGRSVLERDLVPGLEGARRQGLHVADARDLRSTDRAQASELGAPRGLEISWGH